MSPVIYKCLEVNVLTGEEIETEITEEELAELRGPVSPPTEIEPEPPLSPEERLANAGLTVEDLKGLLGLK